MAILDFSITSGAINMDAIRDFFGPPQSFASNVLASRYYRGGNYLPNITENYAVATSGSLNLGSIRGTSVDIAFDTLKTLANSGTVSSPFTNSLSAAWKHVTPWANVDDVGTSTSSAVSGFAIGSYSDGVSPRNGFAMEAGADALAEYYISVSNVLGGATSPVTATVTTVNNGNSTSSSAWGNWSINNDYIVVSAAFSGITSTSWSGGTVTWYSRKQGYNSVTTSETTTFFLNAIIIK